MHPEITAAYSAARAQELRRGPGQSLRPRAYWRVRRKDGVLFRLPAPRRSTAHPAVPPSFPARSS